MTVLLFDVNETLSDMAPLGGRFADVGAPESLAATWFAATLRDGIALTLAGTPRPFAEVARGVLVSLWAAQPVVDDDHESASDHVLDGFGTLGLHPDAAIGLPALAAAGHRLVTLSNGSASVGETLLTNGGVREHVDAVLSVEDADAGGAWKPAAAAYRYAHDFCGCDPADVVLVAVHPWDLHGAKAVGLRTVYIDRVGDTPWPDGFTAPDLRAGGIDDLADALEGVSGPSPAAS